MIPGLGGSWRKVSPAERLRERALTGAVGQTRETNLELPGDLRQSVNNVNPALHDAQDTPLVWMTRMEIRCLDIHMMSLASMAAFNASTTPSRRHVGTRVSSQSRRLEVAAREPYGEEGSSTVQVSRANRPMW